MSVSRALLAVVTSLYLAAVGFSGLELGLLFVVVTLASAVASSGIGLLSDRLGRKPFLVAVPLLSSVATGAFAFATSPPLLFCLAALGTFGRGAGAGGGNVGPYQPAESALVAESVAQERRTSAFGLLAFNSTLGGLLGGLLAGLVRHGGHPGLKAATRAAAAADFRPAFLAACALSAAAGLLALALCESRPSLAATHSPNRNRARRRGGLRFPSRSWPALWRLWVSNGTNGMAIGLFAPFLSYWLYRRYGADARSIGLLFALVNAASLGSTLVAASVGRRLGTVRAISAVRLLGGILLVPMVLAPSFWVAGGIYLVRMIAQRVGLPLRQSFTQELAHPEERSSVAALSVLPSQATMVAGQTLAGYLFDEASLSLPFELAAAFQVANAVAYLALFSWRPPGTKSAPQAQAQGATEGSPPAQATRPSVAGADAPGSGYGLRR